MQALSAAWTLETVHVHVISIFQDFSSNAAYDFDSETSRICNQAHNYKEQQPISALVSPAELLWYVSTANKFIRWILTIMNYAVDYRIASFRVTCQDCFGHTHMWWYVCRLFYNYDFPVIYQRLFPSWHGDMFFWLLFDSTLNISGLWTNHDIWGRHLSPSSNILQTTTNWLIEKIIISQSPSSLITLRSECRQAHMQTAFVLLFTCKA